MKLSFRHILSRRTSGVKFIPEIDGFRFFAIGTVVIYHLNTHLKRVFSSEVDASYFLTSLTNRIASQGSVGVDVFFAISGFILALPFAHQRLFGTEDVNLKAYYIRRITRLEPPYIVSLVIFLFAHLFILREAWGDVFPNFWASVFYVHNIVYDEWSKINPVAWSLEVEVQFYLLAPALATVFSIASSRWRRIFLILVILGSILHYNLNYAMIESLHLRKSLIMHLHQFLIGFLFADFFLTDWKDKLERRSYWFDLLGILSMSALLVYNSPFVFRHDLIFCVALFLSLVCLFKGKLLHTFFTNTWIVIIGGMCYSIYLLHYALIAFFAENTLMMFNPALEYSTNFMIQFLIIIPVVLVISAIFFALIERPCMDKSWPGKLKAKIISIFA